MICQRVGHYDITKIPESWTLSIHILETNQTIIYIDKDPWKILEPTHNYHSSYYRMNSKKDITFQIEALLLKPAANLTDLKHR